MTKETICNIIREFYELRDYVDAIAKNLAKDLYEYRFVIDLRIDNIAVRNYEAVIMLHDEDKDLFYVKYFHDKEEMEYYDQVDVPFEALLDYEHWRDRLLSRVKIEEEKRKRKEEEKRRLQREKNESAVLKRKKTQLKNLMKEFPEVVNENLHESVA